MSCRHVRSSTVATPRDQSEGASEWFHFRRTALPLVIAMVLRPALLETPRLQLITLLAEELRALIACDTERAGQLAALSFPSGWPEIPGNREGLPWHLKQLEAYESHRAWRVRVVVERARQLVIGSITLKGPPDRDGDVEIGWGIDEAFRLEGYASEAAAAVARWASAHPELKSLSATIPDDNVASQRVALRLGMVRTAERRREDPLWRRSHWRCFRCVIATLSVARRRPRR
jgi:[ribosomal protein S5]-alanine N-acetyltransferase